MTDQMSGRDDEWTDEVRDAAEPAASDRARDSGRLISPDEVLARQIRDMGPELGRVFNALRHEVTWVHIEWRMYRQLYGSTESRVDLLNEAAGLFFRVVQDVLLDAVIVHIARLTDPPGEGARKRLTVRRLPGLLPAQLKTTVGERIDGLLIACERLRDWRNRRIAHSDLSIALEAATLAGVSRAMIEDALRPLREILDMIELHYSESQTMYEDAPIGYGRDGDLMMYYLRRGLRDEARQRKRFEEGRPQPEDLEPEEDL